MRQGRIAFLHLVVAPGDIQRNQFVIVEAVKTAAALGAQWIIMPELAVSGLQFPQVVGTDWIQPQPDTWTARLCQLVKSLKRTVILSCPERDAAKLYNSAFVISANGTIVGRHRKIHVVSDSLAWSSPGQQLAPIECDGIKIGLLICSDMYTGNLAGTLKSRGARMLISPTSWGPGMHGPSGEWELRTQETGLPLFVCNRTGTEKTLDFWKAPSLVVKNGKRLLSHTSDRSAVLTFDWSFTGMTPLSAEYAVTYLKG